MSLEEVKARNIHHKAHKAGWLRAAVLGSNDGLVATASLMIGVAAATSHSSANKGFLVAAGLDRKSTRLNSSHIPLSRMPSSA